MSKTYCYVHIPFCELKCKYCRFASVWISQELKINFYIKNLISEIKKSPFKKEILNSVYFWGWTPSILNKTHIEEVLQSLQSKFLFADNIEITLESTPNNVTEKNLKNWYDLWINRLSIWIQTLNENSLKEINRWNKGDIGMALENILKYSSIKNISLDFIVWLPYVKEWEILENIKYTLLKYNFIKHISVYMLEEYYSADKIIETKYDNLTYPKYWNKLWIEDEDYLDEYSKIKNYLIQKWFNNYEISNFWKKWFKCEHNKSYWTHKQVYAFWLWAWWLVEKLGKKYRYLNSDDFKQYYLWKKIFEDRLSDSDIFLEKVMFGLRTSWLEKSVYERLDQSKIKYFIENWYLIKKSDKIILSDSGIIVIDYILGEII